MRAGEPVTARVILCAGPVTAVVIRHTGPKHIWRLAKLPPKHINFLFCYCDSFVKQLTASTSFEISRKQNSNNNGHQRKTNERRLRADVGEARTPRKVMSTPATRHTNGSAGESTKDAQSVRLASGATAGRGIGTTNISDCFASIRVTCANSVPYCVVNVTH